MVFNMKRDFRDAIKHRRTHYGLSNSSPITDNEIQEIIETAVTHVPSAFNSQSTRIVLLLGENHKKLWEIVKDTLRQIVPAEAFKATEAKIDNSFEAGYATILFFEDTEVIEGLQNRFPSYKENFPVWAQQTSAMHQFAIWTLLTDAGFGASLQHYNPLIDEAVARQWNISPGWKLIAQMPFGAAIQEPGEKHFAPLKERILVFK